MDQTKQSLLEHLSNNQWLTVSNLAKRMSVSRRYVRYVLSNHTEFVKFNRSPNNSEKRRRPAWCLKDKLPTK